MKLEELHIGQRVRINDGQDWNDNEHGIIFALEKRRDGRENVGVQLENGMRFDDFNAADIHAPFPESQPNAAMSDAERKS